LITGEVWERGAFGVSSFGAWILSKNCPKKTSLVQSDKRGFIVTPLRMGGALKLLPHRKILGKLEPNVEKVLI